MISTKTILATISLFAASSVSANWSGGIEAGARVGSDNRPTLRLFASNTSDPWSHYAYLDWIRESGESNYRVGYNPTFRISHSFYSFGRFSFEQDDPAGFEQEIDALVGVGNDLLQRGSTRVKIEAGFGAQQLRFTDSTEETDAYTFFGGRVSSSQLGVLRFDASVTTKLSADTIEIDTEAGVSIPIAPGTQLRYVYQVQRFNFDERDNIVSDRNFFTISYGF